MKKILICLAAVCVFTMGFIVSEPLKIGSKMPLQTAKMKATDGKFVTLKELATKNGLLVMFSCNTCPYVIKNQERTNIAMGTASDLAIGTVIINSNSGQRNSDDSYEAMKDYAKDQQYSAKYTIDENNAIADAFGANRTPECFLFDNNLNLVYHGAIDDNPSDASAVQRQHLVEAMTEMANGKKITIEESKSVGCTIKRAK